MILGLQKTSLVDFPGKIVSTVFFGGCNFRCPFCHNKDLVEIGDMSSYKVYSDEDIINHLTENKMFLDGVCITGGEPTLSKGLFDFARKIKDAGFLVKLDTNGTNPGVLKELIDANLLDYIAMDIKGPFDKYKMFINSGVDIEKVKNSVDMIKTSNIKHEFRTTVVPSLHRREDILESVKQLGGCDKYSIQNFIAKNTLDSSFSQEKSFVKEELDDIKKEIIDNSYAKECIVRSNN